MKSLKNLCKRVLQGLRQEELSSVLVALALAAFLLTLSVWILKIKLIPLNVDRSSVLSHLQSLQNTHPVYLSHPSDVICSTPHVVAILKDTLQLSTQTEPAEFKQLQ